MNYLYKRYLNTCSNPCWIQFEDAAKEVADEVTHPRPEGEEEVEDVQVMLHSNANPCSIRDLKVQS